MNIIEIRNLIVTPIGKKGYFKLMGKNKYKFGHGQWLMFVGVLTGIF